MMSKKTMKFKINGNTWKVSIKPMEELANLWNEMWKENNRIIFGCTIKHSQEIWIAEELCREQKIKNFIHEITHCWLWTYGHYFYDNINEECVCEIVANSQEFIEKTKEQFIKELLGDENNE